MTDLDPFDLLTVRETAQALHCSEWTIRRALAEGRIRFFRLRERGAIRIPYFAVEELIKPHLHAATETATRATAPDQVERS